MPQTLTGIVLTLPLHLICIFFCNIVLFQTANFHAYL
uniref:Uncharacterized protein n=1 Tax=Arundo donax TaxID=35708 RepID=A0A0A9FMJ0_ARUDO